MPEQYRLLTIIICVFLGFPVYFLPAFIAAKREHPKRKAILYGNLFTAWTGLGWIVLMFMAAKGREIEPGEHEKHLEE